MLGLRLMKLQHLNGVTFVFVMNLCLKNTVPKILVASVSFTRKFQER